MYDRCAKGGGRDHEIAQIVPKDRRPNAVSSLANPSGYKTHQQRGDPGMQDDARMKLRVHGDQTIGAGKQDRGDHEPPAA